MKRYTRTTKLMGCRFTLGVIANSPLQATKWLDDGVSEIARIERMLTEFKPNSVTSRINEEAVTHPVVIPKEVLDLIDRANQISRLSHGFFDITMGALKKLYKFNNEVFLLPSKHEIKRVLKKVGYQGIHLDPSRSTIRFRKKGMRISFAAIGKGYAADKVLQLWKKEAIPGGFVNASGDLAAFGANEKGDPWSIGIAHPDNPETTLFRLPILNSAVATSGDYEQHFVHKGVRYSHTIDPRTGYPVCAIKSVSVFSPSAELSDALATAVSSMGIKKGLSFIEQLPNTHAILVDSENQIHFTQQLHYEAVS
ncbi:MAG: FAD:protein FMN transferase [Flavobacteriaceae bacterium]|nr:FAD:protein FMN transferase [Flavobacteriaceae bacterium]